MTTKLVAGAILVAAFMVIFRCTADKVAGNGTQTGNPTVAGVLYNANGARAVHATVRFYPVNYDPQTGSLGKTKTVAAVTGIDSTTTDGSGNYSATLDSGSYNLLASGDTTLAYHDSVHVMKGDTARPIDTLRSPGALRGVIQMQGSDDPRTVFIIFIGTGGVYAPQDSLGNFLIPKLAQGSYHVRFLTTLDNYKVKDTTLGVTAGKIDTLAAPIQLQYTGIPVPAGLHIQYDTNMQVVTLIWNKPTTGSPIKGYEIYRSNVDSNTQPKIINTQLITDTVYHDSSGVQDMSYEYYVAAVDTNQTPGVKSGGVSIIIRELYELFDSIPLPYSNGLASLAISPTSQLYGVQDSIILHYNPATKALAKSWTMPQSIGVVQKVVCLNDSILILANTQALIEFSINSQTFKQWSASNGIYGRSLAAVDSFAYFTHEFTLGTTYIGQICRLNLNSSKIDTILSTNQNFAAIGGNSIEGIWAGNSYIAFDVGYYSNSEGSSLFNVYSYNTTSGISQLLLTMPVDSNADPCFSAVNDSIFLFSEGPNTNTCRLIIGGAVAKWSLPLGSMSIAMINSQYLYVSGAYNNIYIYRRR